MRTRDGERRQRSRLLMTMLLIVFALPGLLQISAPSAEAAGVSWQQSVAALARSTPRETSLADIGLAARAVDGRRDGAAARAVARLQAVASAAYLSDGVHFRSPVVLRQVFAQQQRTAVVLQSSMSSRAGKDRRTVALVRVLAAATTSAQQAVRDVATVTKPTAGVKSPTPNAASLLSARYALARTELAQMRAALRKPDAGAAVQHAQASYLAAESALQAVGVDPLRNGSKAADADRDQLPDSLELIVGSNPRLVDTDHDTLPDFVEVTLFSGALRPDKADSDHDGIRDDREDSDGDRLSNKAELAFGSDPIDPDSDADGLRDLQEKQRKTKPLVADTDGDGLNDGAEVRAGLNPLSKDSNGDGVPDGAAAFSQPLVTPPGVTATVQAIGDLASVAHVLPVDATSPEVASAPGRVGDVYSFELPADRRPELLGGAITLPYDPAKVTAGTDPAGLRIFTFDDTTRTWLQLAATQAVDTTAHTVAVPVTHFSHYAVFDPASWQTGWENIATGCTPGATSLPVDVPLVIDSSGSMTDNDPSNLRLSAAKSFISALGAGDRAAVIDFDTVATVRANLTGDKTALAAAVDGVDALGGTDIGVGLSAGLDQLTASDGSRLNTVVLLTDGEGAFDDTLLTTAQQKHVAVFTIGLGVPNSSLLQRIATTTGGRFYGVSEAAGLPQIFRSLLGCVNNPTPLARIALTNCGYTDTDSDGLPDCIETGGYVLGFGKVVKTDPANADSDGDGLSDGDEAGPGDSTTITAQGLRFYQATSDPTLADSDGDGLSDVQEIDEETLPLVADTDGDGLNDLAEVGAGFDPTSADPDGDGRLDGQEYADGSDPFMFDIGKAQAAKAVLLGAVFGDAYKSWLARHAGVNDTIGQSIWYLTGQLLSGYVGVGDIRDLIYDAGTGAFGLAILAAIALVPAYGDAAKTVADLLAFAARGSRAVRAAVTIAARVLPKSKREGFIAKIAGAKFARTQLDIAAEARGRVPRDANFNIGRGTWTKGVKAVSKDPEQAKRLQAALDDLVRRRLAQQDVRDVRVNQWQVDINGRTVGINRPDLQYTLNGKRYYVEFDKPLCADATRTLRGDAHEMRIKANDASGVVLLVIAGLTCD